MKSREKFLLLLAVIILILFSYTAEKVGIFADDDVTSTKLVGDVVGPLRFAAEDVKKALVVQKYDVEVLPLTSLTVMCPYKKRSYLRYPIIESLPFSEDFRTYEIKALGWHSRDHAVLRGYANLGGVGTPELPKFPTASPVPSKTSPLTGNADSFIRIPVK